MKILHYLKQLLFLILGLGIFLYLLKSQPQESIMILRNTRLSGLFLLIIAALLVYIMAGIAMVFFIRTFDPHFPFLRGIKIEFLSLLMENLTIGVVGKGTQMILLHRQKLTWEQSICCIGFDFISFQFTTFLFSVMVFSDAFLKTQFAAELPAVLMGFIGDVAPLIGAGLVLYMPGISRILHYVEAKIAIRPKRLKLTTIRNGLRTLKQERDMMHQPKRIALVLSANFIRILLRHILPMIAMYALCVPIPVESIIHLFVASIFIELMISIVPITGKHGIAESAFLLIYSVLLPTGSAVGVMLLWRLAVYYIPTFFAIIVFLLSPEITWQSLHQKRAD